MYNDAVTAAETICDTKLELPVETEILIPDYLPQVFKIVKCMVSAIVLQKQVSGARLTLEGYLRLVVLYQSDSETEGLCRTEQKMPFSKQIDLHHTEAPGACVTVRGETEYVNCRAINQRRIDIRGAYALGVHVKAQTQSQIITAMSDSGIEQKMLPISGLQTLALQDKLITVEETVAFDAPPAMILHIACAANVQETKLVAGKAVLKGTLSADITYRAEDSPALRHTQKELLFNEVLEVPGAEESCQCVALAEATGCTITAAEDGTNALSVTALLQVKVYRNVEILAVCDAYSTQYETALTYGEAHVERLQEMISQQAEAVAQGTLPDPDAVLVDVFTEALLPELVQQGEVCVVRGRVLVHMLCRNTLGEIDCYDKACEYTLPRVYNAPQGDLFLWAQAGIVEANARKTGETASVTVLVRVQGVVTQRTAGKVLQQVVCEEPYAPQESNVALRIYYAQPGEQVFDIARRYRVPVAALINTNTLDSSEIVQKTQLLIPSQV